MKFSQLFARAATAQSKSGQRVVGIDVGSSSIKVVELQNRNDVVTLTTYGELQLGPYLDEKPIGSSVILTPSLERQALVDILRESAVKARSAVFAMPLSASFVTVMNMIAAADEDISARVRVEARKYIPVPIGDVTLDWAEVEMNKKDSEESRDILLAAIQNDALARFKTLLQSVEFPSAPTEIECFSAIRGLYNPGEDNVAIIDIGAVSTKLYLVHKGLLQRVYRVRAGGALCTDVMVKEMNMSFDEAEQLKRTITSDDERFAAVQKINHNHYSRALRELTQVLEDYESRTGTTVQQVYLIGGGAQFAGLSTYIGSQLGRSVAMALPFNKVAYPAFMEDTMNEIGSSFVVALGAALRAFEE
jgi:type IV pilus assembly protein PilM